MSGPRLQTKLLLQAGRMLLEYGESTGAIHRALTATAKAVTDESCHIAILYRGIAISLAGDSLAMEPVKELRYNMAVQARVHEILEQVRGGALDISDAIAQLGRVDVETPRHSRWMAALVLGAAAASFAVLLGGDGGAVTIAGLATALGLLVRQELGRRHFSLLVLPLSASLIGAVLGGLAIRWGWTRTPQLVLVVPALMVVPGPHLINGLLDLIDNYLPMALARFGLAIGIVLASAAGIVLGVELTLPDLESVDPYTSATDLNVVSDMTLAGIAACGFSVFYNTPWRQVWQATLGGMAGHGLRFLALEAGCRLEAATFLGGLAVGIISAWISRSRRMPVAVTAFAGAVTMIPGLHIYRALSGALQLAWQTGATDSGLVAATFGCALQACLVVCALTLGLVLGARTISLLLPDRWGVARFAPQPRPEPR
jgi:uncharacterized membrane protein YjjP (DUF1212 family)